MKVLLLGDASNYHAALAPGLAELGHDVTIASHGSRWMATKRDIDISRREGKIGGAMLWLRLNRMLWHELAGYDIVQICGTHFADLQPERISSIFDKIKRKNGAIYLTDLATTAQYVQMCTSQQCPLQYSEFRIGQQKTNYALLHPEIEANWLSPRLADYCRHIYDNVDGVVTALYEYHLSCLQFYDPLRLQYAGIPIVVSQHEPNIKTSDKISIVVAAHKGRELVKGIDLMLPVIENVAKQRKDKVDFKIVQNLPFAEFKHTIENADIVVDQLYSYTPATTALMAMAAGKVTVSGGEEEYYNFIGEKTMRPIINPDPTNLDALHADLLDLIDNPQRLRRLSEQGRRLVNKHNATLLVAERFQSLWQR